MLNLVELRFSTTVFAQLHLDSDQRFNLWDCTQPPFSAVVTPLCLQWFTPSLVASGAAVCVVGDPLVLAPECTRRSHSARYLWNGSNPTLHPGNFVCGCSSPGSSRLLFTFQGRFRKLGKKRPPLIGTQLHRGLLLPSRWCHQPSHHPTPPLTHYTSAMMLEAPLNIYSWNTPLFLVVCETLSAKHHMSCTQHMLTEWLGKHWTG